jgi:hypothetical protein
VHGRAGAELLRGAQALVEDDKMELNNYLALAEMLKELRTGELTDVAPLLESLEKVYKQSARELGRDCSWRTSHVCYTGHALQRAMAAEL